MADTSFIDKIRNNVSRLFTRPISDGVSVNADANDISPNPFLNEESSRHLGIDGFLSYYRETAVDPIVQNSMSQRFSAAIKFPYDILPGADDPLSIEAEEGIKEIFSKMDIDSISKMLLYANMNGYAVGELIFEMADNYIGLNDIIVRAPDRFRFDKNNELRLKVIGDPEGKRLDQYKFIIARKREEHMDSPFSAGLLRFIYPIVQLKKTAHQDWARASRRFAQPIPIAYNSAAAAGDKKVKLAVKQVIEGIIAGRGGMLDDRVKIEFLQAAKEAGLDFKQYLTYLDDIIREVIIGSSGTSVIGQYTGTAQVLSQTKNDIVKSDIALLNEIFNRQVISLLTELNWPGAAYPKMVRNVIKDAAELKVMAEVASILWKASPGYNLSREYVESAFNIPVDAWEETETIVPDQGENAAEQDSEDTT